MDKISNLLRQLCPEGVRIEILGDVTRNNDSKRLPVTRTERVPGNIPYYGANGVQDFVRDHIFDGVFLLIGEDGSVLQSNGRPVLNWAEGKIWVNNHAHVLSEISKEFSLRFIFYFLSTVDVSTYVTGGTQKKLNQSNLNRIPVPIPPIEIQNKIVDALDKFTQLEAELEAELEARKKQYEALRSMYLDFDLESNVNPLSEKIRELCPDGVEFRNLSTFVRIRNGKDYKHLPKGDNPVYGSGGVIAKVSGDFGLTDSVLIPRKGSLRNLFHVSRPFWTVDTIFYTEIGPGISSKFLFHYLRTLDLANLNQAGGVPSLTQSQLNKLPLPLLPLEIQKEIVGILDNLESMTTSLSSGLPAEIAARKKQYDYYRDKLLTFKELKSA